jgi:hypothetical protein
MFDRSRLFFCAETTDFSNTSSGNIIGTLDVDVNTISGHVNFVTGGCRGRGGSPLLRLRSRHHAFARQLAPDRPVPIMFLPSHLGLADPGRMAGMSQ